MPRVVFRGLQVVVQPKGKVALAKLKAQAAVKSGVVHHLHFHFGLAVHTRNAGLALGLYVSRRWNNSKSSCGLICQPFSVSKALAKLTPTGNVQMDCVLSSTSKTVPPLFTS